jgi:DNA-binding transcriptional LysR family regulator
VDLELLRTFVTVVHRRGMRRAAEVLHVTQPAVSARIRELERQLDSPLFERLGRRLHLTEAGRVLLEEGGEMLAAADDLQQKLSRLRGLERGTLRLATIDAVSIYLLPEVYLEFRRAHPQIELIVQVVDSRRVLAAVRDLEADLGFLALPGAAPRPPSQPELEIVPICEDRLVCVASPSHTLAAERHVDLAAIASQPLVLYSRGSNTRAALDAVFRSHGLVPNVVMETESPEAMRRLAEVGVGIAILPEAQIRDVLAAGRLHALFPTDARFHRILATARRRGRALAPAAQRFLALVEQRWPGLDAGRLDPPRPRARRR